jgi:hypothetical protein
VESFTAQYFIDQILSPLSQEYFMKSADIARRSLQLQFDNSGCHPVNIVSEEMISLKWKRVPHPADSPDLAIADFYLFGVLKQKSQGIDASDDEKLNSEILTIFQGIPSGQLKIPSITEPKDASGLPQCKALSWHPMRFSSMSISKTYWTT